MEVFREIHQHASKLAKPVIVETEGVVSEVPLHLGELPPQTLYDLRELRIALPIDAFREVYGVGHVVSFLSSANKGRNRRRQGYTLPTPSTRHLPLIRANSIVTDQPFLA